jgi:hypothetical protein
MSNSFIKCLAILLNLILIFSCNPERKSISKLEKFVNSSSSSKKDSILLQNIISLLFFARGDDSLSIPIFHNNDSTGLIKQQTLLFLHDTIKKAVLVRIEFLMYKSDKSASLSFLKEIEEICNYVVLDSNTFKLKNFENGIGIKLNPIKLYLIENIVVKFSYDWSTGAHKYISNELEKILIEKPFLKLEIGGTWPEIWTINKIVI